MATITTPRQATRGGVAQQQERQFREARARPADMLRVERMLPVLGGGALALFGLSRGSLAGLGLALLGGGLAARSVTRQAEGVRVTETTSILRAPQELYSFWRNFENLPRFMHYLETVRTLDDRRSHWVAKGPLEARVEWDAEITEDRPNELIAWRSLPGSTVDTEGVVRFIPAPANRGTWVQVTMRYTPPAGKIGDMFAALFGRSGRQEAREDLRRFKRLMETGEIPTTKGQSSGRGKDMWEQTGSMVIQDRIGRGLGWFSIGLGLAELLSPRFISKVSGVPERDGIIRLFGAREIAQGVGILTQRDPTPWLWARVVGDALDIGSVVAALNSPRADRAKATATLTSLIGITAVDVIASLQHSFSPNKTSDGQATDRNPQVRTSRAGSEAWAR